MIDHSVLQVEVIVTVTVTVTATVIVGINIKLNFWYSGFLKLLSFSRSCLVYN